MTPCLLLFDGSLLIPQPPLDETFGDMLSADAANDTCRTARALKEARRAT
jgi:hypothetical protein